MPPSFKSRKSTGSIKNRPDCTRRPRNSAFNWYPSMLFLQRAGGPPMVSQVPEHHVADRTTSKRNPVKSKCEALQAAQLSEDGSGWSHEPAAHRERIFHLDPVDSMRHWLRSTGPGYCS